MKPFNIEEAKKNPSRVIYRNGTRPIQVFFADHAKPWNKIITIDDIGDVISHSDSGEFNLESANNHFDLVLQEPELFVILKEENNGTKRIIGPWTETRCLSSMMGEGDKLYRLTEVTISHFAE